MENRQLFIWQKHINPHNSQNLGIVIVILIALFIPLSVYLTGQNQANKQSAQILTPSVTLTPQQIDQGVIVINQVPDPKVGKIPGELIVEFRPASGSAIANIESTSQRIRNRHGGTVRKQRVRNSNVRTVAVPKGDEATIITDLKNDPNVESVEQDSYASILEVPNDPKFPEQYGFLNTGQEVKTSENKMAKGTAGADVSMPAAWNVTTGKDDVIIAILDTGIDDTHPDLKGKVIKHIKISDTESAKDVHGHGTHVAGVAAGLTNNGIGVAGTCPKCKLLNVKVMGDNGQGRTSWITEGINAAVAEGADVINISAGTFDDSEALHTAVDNAISKGVVIVAAAGNCGDGADTCPSENPPMYPAHYPEVISVSATDMNDKKPDYAQYGETVDVTAPGDAILSTYKDNKYAIMNGTSMSSPLVAGLAGLLFTTDFGTSVQNITNRIQSTADKIDGTGTFWRYGRVNAAKALGYDTTASPTPPSNNTSTPNKSGSTAKSDELAATMQLTVFINGIGKATPGGNPNPLNKTRTFTAEIIDNATADTKTVDGTLAYDAVSGGFVGSIPISNIQSGDYEIAIRSISTLPEVIPDTVTLAQPNKVTLPTITLLVGDINADGVIDIRDFNILAGCFSLTSPAKSCADAQKAASDLNDDGKVNELDYNLFLRNLATQLSRNEVEDEKIAEDSNEDTNPIDEKDEAFEEVQ
jgi:thermitase